MGDGIEAPLDSEPMIGSIVRVRPGIEKTKYGWGQVCPGEQGVVKALPSDGCGKLRVDFPSQLNWGAHPPDVELVPVSEIISPQLNPRTDGSFDATNDPGPGAMAPQAPPPPPLAGHLWKQSPSVLRMFAFQRRYVEVRGSRLCWWRDKPPDADAEGHARDRDGHLAAGVIDLGRTPCSLDTEARDGLFSIRPLHGEAWEGSTRFTGDRHGRVFTFDVRDSEHTHSRWTQVIR